MRVAEIDFGGAPPVDGYGPGFFRIAGARHDGPVLITRDGPAAWGGLDDTAPLLALAGRIDVLLVGMGDAIAALPAELRAPLEEAGIGVDTMATPPACRTWNVVLAEGRRAAAALIPVARTRG